MREKLAGLGFDVVASTPEEFARDIRIEVAKWTKVIKQAGIKVE
jgi:tripartite-type tricarboxylate transporter receptor subunit TctC